MSSFLAMEFPFIRPLSCSCLISLNNSKQLLIICALKYSHYPLTEIKNMPISFVFILYCRDVSIREEASLITSVYECWLKKKHSQSHRKSLIVFTLTTSCLKSRMLCHWLRRLRSASWRLRACLSIWIHLSLRYSLAAICITHCSSSPRTDLGTTRCLRVLVENNWK